MTKARFNLVCHGLMAFWRKSPTQMMILIPDDRDHEYKIGHPSGGASGEVLGLDALPAGPHLKLMGVQADPTMTNSRLVESFAGPVLHGSEFRVQQARTAITIPMPCRIRSYRTAEVDRRALEGMTTRAFIARGSDTVSEVTVLSWFAKINSPEDVHIINSDNPCERFPAAKSNACNDKAGVAYLSLCVYAQPEVEGCNSNAQAIEEHGACWNDMFAISGIAGGELDFHLAMGAAPDPPPPCTTIGVEQIHLLSLCELPQHNPDIRTERAGCGSACFCC